VAGRHLSFNRLPCADEWGGAILSPSSMIAFLGFLRLPSSRDTPTSAPRSRRSQQRWESRSSEHDRDILLPAQLEKPGISRERQENAGRRPDQRAL
jgi:hypothetical protein